MSFFIDSSGLIEVAKGNKNYSKYLDQDVVTSKDQLVIFYSEVSKKYGDKVAGILLKELQEIVVEVPTEFVSKGFDIAANKNKKLLIYDLIDYQYTIENKRLFLTSNRKFKGFSKAVVG